jgi:hypothetical protein
MVPGWASSLLTATCRSGRPRRASMNAEPVVAAQMPFCLAASNAHASHHRGHREHREDSIQVCDSRPSRLGTVPSPRSTAGRWNRSRVQPDGGRERLAIAWPTGIDNCGATGRRLRPSQHARNRQYTALGDRRDLPPRGAKPCPARPRTRRSRLARPSLGFSVFVSLCVLCALCGCMDFRVSLAPLRGSAR